MKKSWKNIAFALAFTLSLSSVYAGPKDPKLGVPFNGEYNHGPDPTTKMGRWLMDLYANLPEYFALSENIMDRQKFRYTFGTMMARAFFEPNRTKVFFVGQDATGIAELSKRPGVSGFGGQVQGLASYFGVDQGVATTNAYLSTISGQYGAFGHIYVEADAAGKPVIRQTKYVDNELWAITHHPGSEIRITREKYWEWMIMNNPESMDMMVFFGDAAKDTFAQFLMARGFEVPIKMNPDKLKNIQVPETILVNAGGNSEFPVPVNKKGQDVYEILLEQKHGRVPPYFKKDARSGKFEINYGALGKDKKTLVTQIEAVKALQEAGEKGVEMMVFTGGGIHGSGLTDLGQIAEFDFNNVTFKGEKVRSLKGMKLKYFDATVDREIAFIESPHPTVLAGMTAEKKASTLKTAFKPLEILKAKGWTVTPDVDANGKPYVNGWDAGVDYVHKKKEIGTAYLEQGAPANRRTSSADFVRDGKQKIIGNTRNKAQFDRAREEIAIKSVAAKPKNPDDLYSARPRNGDLRYVYDDGPGDEISKLMADQLDLETILAPKPGKKVLDERGRDVTFETHGIDAYNVKSHPGAEYFGTHRGSFKKSRALILADPHGVDDWTTSRALTGARGQYLHGMMEDLGYGEDYLVIKTAPFAMDRATKEEWEFVRQHTEKYREALIAKALENKIEIIFVDGPIAKAEMDRILKSQKITGISVVEIARTGLADPSEGVAKAGKEAATLLRKSAKISGTHADIPTSHLPWWSRVWEGTGGVDLTIDAIDANRGLAVKVITPNWVAFQDVKLLATTTKSIERIRGFLTEMRIRVGKEKLVDFLKDNNGSWRVIEENRKAFFAGRRPAIPVFSYEKCVDLLMKSATARNLFTNPHPHLAGR